MTRSFTDKRLTRSKLQSMMSAVKGHVSEEIEKVDAIEYNWQQPHHFNNEHLAMLDTFGKKLASHLSKTITGLCQEEHEAHITSISQHFACSLAEQILTDQAGYYFLPFSSGSDDSPCGFITISPQISIVLVAHMLRDIDIEPEQERNLSPLEESILLDSLSVLVDSLTTAFKENAGPTIRRAAKLVQGTWPLNFDKQEDVCSFDFKVDHPKGAIEATFTMLSKVLEPVIGIKRKSGPKLSPQQISDTIMNNVQEALVEITAQLTTANMCINDIMNLEQGDILVLDKKITEPVDVLLNKHRCMKAYPARTKSKYAIVIAPDSDE